MSTRNKILAGLLVLSIVCLVVWVVKTTPNAPLPRNKIDPPTVMEYAGNTITEEKDGVIIWEMTCKRMLIDTITQNMELIGVTGKFYQRDEKNTVWNLKAEHGIYYQTQDAIYVEGNVTVTNTNGAELLCDKLEWFDNDGKLIANGNVKVDDGDGTKIAADKIDWFTNNDDLIATGNVKISHEDMRGYGDLAYAREDFKKFGLIGNAKVLKGVKDD